VAQNTDYPTYMHNVGGKEPDGKPTRIGKWTFETKMVRDVVVDNLEGDVLNACAGKTRLEDYCRGVNILRNDINPSVPATLHEDAQTLDEHLEGNTFDVVVNDPPFDSGRADELYAGMHASDYIDLRQTLGKLVKRGGTYIELGWNSWGMGDTDGWQRLEHHLYRQPFKGDVHLVVEKKIDQRTVGEY